MHVLKVLDLSIDNKEVLNDIVLFIRTEVVNSEERIKLAIEFGLLPKLISLLECPSSEIKLEIVLSVEAIFVKLKEENEVLFKTIEKIVGIIAETKATAQLKEQTLLSLTNIAANSIKAKDIILSTDLLQILKCILDKIQPMTIKRACSILIAELSFTSSTQIVITDRHNEAKTQISEIAKNLMKEEEITTYALRALVRITQLEEITIDEQTILSNTISFIQGKEVTIKMLAIQVIGNICAGTEDSLNRAVKAGVLEALILALEDEKESDVIVELCWAIGTVALGASCYVGKLLSIGVVNKLVKLSVSSSEFKVRKAGGLALVDLCEEATEYQIMKIVKAKGLDALTNLLEENNVELVERVLEGINTILAAGEESEEENKLIKHFDSLGGHTKLQNLLMHSNNSIFSKARAIIQKYYAMDELKELLKFKALSDRLNSIKVVAN